MGRKATPEWAWVEIDGRKIYAVSTEEPSHLKAHESAIMWLVFGLIGAKYARVKRRRLQERSVQNPPAR
jgi:hypothetical protein